MAALLEPGRRWPDFSLEGADGRTWTLNDLLGRRAVLFFFPKANTPG